MHTLQSLLYAPFATVSQVFGVSDSMIGLAAIVLSLTIPIVAIVAVFYTKNRREELWHETARLAIEKGQPIPPRPLSDEDIKSPPPPAGADLAEWDRLNRARKHRRDIRNGLVLLAIGAAMNMGHFGGGNGSFPGYILMFMGAAFLLNGLLNGASSPKP